MKKALVYFPSFTSNIGGSEYLVFTIIQSLQKRYDVTLVLREMLVSPAEAAKTYDARVDWSRVSVVDLEPRGRLAKFDRHLKIVGKRRLRKMGKLFDVCVSCANPVDFGRPGIHFVYMMNFDRPFQTWAQGRRPQGDCWIHHSLVILRDGVAFMLAGARTPRQIVGDSREVVLPNSNYVRGMIERHYKCKIHEAFYPPTLFETDLPNCGNRESIGYIGRIQPEKRIVELIEIVRQAREALGLDLKFHLAGDLPDLPYENKIRLLARRYSWIVLHGPLVGRAKKEFLSSFALALHGRKVEEFGIAITEYLKAGVVPVVPSVGGCAEIVNDEELTYADDREAVSIVIRLIKDDEFFKKKLAACQGRSTLFSEASYLARQSAMLRELRVER